MMGGCRNIEEWKTLQVSDVLLGLFSCRVRGTERTGRSWKLPPDVEVENL